jgi:hypothetical protein
MANKKSKSNKQTKSSENQDKRRIRLLQIFFALFCVVLILSMVLSLTAKKEHSLCGYNRCRAAHGAALYLAICIFRIITP